jgi:hypothetical protein
LSTLSKLRSLRINRYTRDELLYFCSPAAYIRSLGFNLYDWQESVIDSDSKRVLINGARQAGKSTLVAGRPCHRAKYYPRSLSIIIASTEKQAVEDMEKVKHFMARDPNYPKIVRDSDSLIEITNSSRVLVVPGTETSARGYSNPDELVLDESSRIGDPVYRGGIRPMLTDNQKCVLTSISTPNGRFGFFFRAWRSERWERYAIRSPWDPIPNGGGLVPAQPEKYFKAEMAKQGVHGYYSPRHRNEEEQLENLEEMGERLYRQEYCCEFVEPEDQVFSYDQIERAFVDDIRPLQEYNLDDDGVRPLAGGALK